MKLKAWTLVCTLLVSAALYAADPPKKSEPSAEEKAAMEAMMKAATPGEAHKKLDGMVGTWSAKVTMWPAPGVPPQVSTGTSTAKWVMGGRFIEENFTGNMMGMPFTGRGYTGYDNIKKQYFGSWMDNMSTAMMMTTGTQDSDNTWTFKGTMPDPMSGKDTPLEEKVTVQDKDHHTFEMWTPAPDGRMFKMMEITYTRKAAGKK